MQEMGALNIDIHCVIYEKFRIKINILRKFLIFLDFLNKYYPNMVLILWFFARYFQCPKYLT